MRFHDKVVWITGASSGIGEGLAYALHAEGARLILSARREEELRRVAAACGESSDEIVILPFDVAAGESLAGVVETATASHGRIDMLINNAGISQRSLTLETGLDVYRRLMEVDYFSAVALTKLVLPGMIERRSGHLVATSSVAGKYGLPMRSGYCAAKHALHGFYDTLRAEIWKYDIKVSLLVVGSIRTQVSLHALTGDGGSWGTMDRYQDGGMSPEEAASIILRGLARNKEEIAVGRGRAMQALKLKRFFPGLWSRLVRRLGEFEEQEKIVIRQ